MLRRGDVAHMELFFGLEIAIDDIYGNPFFVFVEIFSI